MGSGGDAQFGIMATTRGRYGVSHVLELKFKHRESADRKTLFSVIDFEVLYSSRRLLLPFSNKFTFLNGYIRTMTMKLDDLRYYFEKRHPVVIWSVKEKIAQVGIVLFRQEGSGSIYSSNQNTLAASLFVLLL